MTVSALRLLEVLVNGLERRAIYEKAERLADIGRAVKQLGYNALEMLANTQPEIGHAVKHVLLDDIGGPVAEIVRRYL